MGGGWGAAESQGKGPGEAPGETCEFRDWPREGCLPTVPGLRPGPQPAQTPPLVSGNYLMLSQTQNAVIPSEGRPEGAVKGVTVPGATHCLQARHSWPGSTRGSLENNCFPICLSFNCSPQGPASSLLTEFRPVPASILGERFSLVSPGEAK